MGGWLLAVIAVVILRLFGSGQADFLRHLDYWQPVLAVTGAVIAIAATALLLWARWTLGAMWASVPVLQEQHRLVTHGPYGIVRHPIYTGLLGLAFGATLTFGFGSRLLLLAFVTVLVLRRVYVEDRLMAGEFGGQYDAYRARVPALFPSVQLFKT
jgi:protein-S-isoprenylcysteine O-methyltransferase Ste14